MPTNPTPPRGPSAESVAEIHRLIPPYPALGGLSDGQYHSVALALDAARRTGLTRAAEIVRAEYEQSVFLARSHIGPVMAKIDAEIARLA